MRQPSLAERQEAAAAAKKELLERHREKLNDPGFTERQAAMVLPRPGSSTGAVVSSANSFEDALSRSSSRS